MRSRLPLALVFILCSACGGTQPVRPSAANAQDFERDRRHCESEMYSQRMARGRSAPSWTIYDYCMKSRGHSREETSG
jgi:hypothetical protein